MIQFGFSVKQEQCGCTSCLGGSDWVQCRFRQSSPSWFPLPCQNRYKVFMHIVYVWCVCKSLQTITRQLLDVEMFSFSSGIIGGGYDNILFVVLCKSCLNVFLKLLTSDQTLSPQSCIQNDKLSFWANLQYWFF